MLSMTAVGSIGSLPPQLIIASPPLPAPPLAPAVAPPPLPPPPSGVRPASELQPPPPVVNSSTAKSQRGNIVAARGMSRSCCCRELEKSGQGPGTPFGLAEGAIGDAHRIEDRNQHVVVGQPQAV